MDELWIVSVPWREKTAEEAYQELVRNLNAYATCTKFSIPDMKVGTMDSLVSMSDQLAKMDPSIEIVVRKLARFIYDILSPDERPKFKENLVIGPKKVPVDVYVNSFQWDNARYPSKQSIPNILDMINKITSDIEAEFKRKTTTYNNLKSQMQAIERRERGNLMTKSLSHVVVEQDVVIGSEYMQTLLVVVPRSLYKDWERKYEKLTEMVVPRSSKKIAEDAEHGLWSVTLFRKMVEEFKTKAREDKFIVRDFEYNPKSIKMEKEQKHKLEQEIAKQSGPLMNWLKINFGVAFTSWIHLKALRTFVESVLRYGLPLRFQAAVIGPKKSEKKVLAILKQLYDDLDTRFDVKDEEQIDLPGITSQDYKPYVFFKVNTDLHSK